MIKILLVEDDLGLSNSVFDFLDDFADVMQVFDGEEGLYEAESGVYAAREGWFPSAERSPGKRSHNPCSHHDG